MRQTTFVLLLMVGSFCLGWHFAPGPEPKADPWATQVQAPQVPAQKPTNTRPKPRPKPTDDAPRANLE